MAGRARKLPRRSCVACRTQRDQRELIRLVRAPRAEAGAPAVQIDERGRAAGRGAYLCADQACWTRAIEGNVLVHALRAEVSAADRDTLRRFAEERFASEGVAGGVR